MENVSKGYDLNFQKFLPKFYNELWLQKNLKNVFCMHCFSIFISFRAEGRPVVEMVFFDANGIGLGTGYKYDLYKLNTILIFDPLIRF